MMAQWAARPLWVAGVVSLAVCLAAAWMPPVVLQWALVICAIALVAVLAIPPVRRLRVPTVALLACVFALACFIVKETTQYQPVCERVGETVYVEAQVREVGETVQLRVQGGDLPSGMTLRLYANKFDIQLTNYEILAARMTLLNVEGQGLKKLQQKSGDCLFVVEFADTNIVRRAGDVPWTDVFVRAREHAVEWMESTLTQGPAAVVSGICFGEDSKLPVTAVSDFRTCGVSHLFAVSGLHMSVLAAALLLLLRKLRAPRACQAIITLAALFAFMMMVGLSASVVRAGILCALVLVGNCLRRQADTRTSLGLALLILLGANPYAAYDVGLLLSFTATYGLVVWSGPLQQLFLHVLHNRQQGWFAGMWKGLATSVAVTFAATFATAPVLVIYFGTLPLLSVPANLLTGFAATVILVAGCLAALIMTVLPFVSELLLTVCGWLAEYLLWVCRTLANLPFASVFVKTTQSILWIAGAYVLVALGWLFYRKRGMLLSASVAVLVLCAVLVGNHVLLKGRVTAQCVAGTKDLAVCVYFEGYTVAVVSPSIVDTLYDVRSQLEQQHVSRVDMLVLLGEKATAVGAVTDVLYEYITAQTQVLYEGDAVPFAGIHLVQAAVRFSKDGNLVLQDGYLQMTIGENKLVFAAHEDARLPADFVETPLLFLAGKVEVFGTQPGASLTKVVLTNQTDEPIPAFILHEGEVFVSTNYKRR